MQTVDLVIGGLGVVAVIATTLGVVFYEEAAGEQTLEFRETGAPDSDSRNGVSAGEHDLSIDLPDNATALTGMRVTITFTGSQSPVAQDGGSYSVEVHAPGDANCTGDEAAWGAGETTISLDNCRFAQPPSPVETTDPGSVDETITWDEPFTVTVSITDPDDALAGNAGATYTYDIEFSANVQSYRAAIASPDVDTL